MAIGRGMLSRAAGAAAVAALATAPGRTADDGALFGWDAGQLQGGWRAEQMTDAPVYGGSGAEIGEVADIVVGPDDQVQAFIVEADAFLDFGDVHLRVPWDLIDLTPGTEGVRVPVDEDNVADFGLFGEEVETRPRARRVSELIGDDARLAGGEGYGVVDDLVFSEAGELQAVVVTPDVGVGGSFAYPWSGYGYDFDPGADVLDMPYTWEQTGELPPFDYDMYEGVF